MYTVEFAEHFEDWYVAYGETSSFESFNDAIQYFLEKCMNVINNNSSGSGIDNYIVENHQEEAEDDPKWFREYSTGFFFTVESDDNQVFFLHLDYDPETRSIFCDANIEVDEEQLTPSEISKVQRCLVKIKECLTPAVTRGRREATTDGFTAMLDGQVRKGCKCSTVVLHSERRAGKEAQEDR